MIRDRGNVHLQGATFAVAIAMAVLCACAAPASGGETPIDDSGWRAGPSPDWFVNWDKALAEARKTGKALFLLNTGSDWCGWCKRLKADVLDTRKFADFARRKLILVYLDNPRDPLCEAQAKHNRSIVRALPFGGGVPHALVMNAKGEKLGAISGGGQTVENYLDRLGDILKAKGEPVPGEEAKRLFAEPPAEKKVDVKPAAAKTAPAPRRPTPPPAAEADFRAVVTGLAIVDNAKLKGPKEGIFFNPPETPLDAQQGQMALFRVEYDFPQGHGARLWVLPELCDDGEGHNGDFGANKSGLYTGKGVAYDFIALNADGSSRMLKSIAVAVEAKLEEDGTPRKWTVATSPVDIAFWERK